MRGRAAIAIVALSALPAIARASDSGDSRFGANDIRSLFFIATSEDRDQVHYGIRLDKDCIPLGKEPVYAYWRQFEQGPDVTDDLNALDRTAYGIKDQWVTKRSSEESRVIITLRAASDRPLTIAIRKRDGRCSGEAWANINATAARLDSVFVHVAGFLRVDWIDIKGTLNGKPIVERIRR